MNRFEKNILESEMGLDRVAAIREDDVTPVVDDEVVETTPPPADESAPLPTTDGERNFDAEKCSRYMKEHFQDIGRGSVCGICIKVCPKNKL